MSAKALSDLTGPELDTLARENAAVRAAFAATNAAGRRLGDAIAAVEKAEAAVRKARAQEQSVVASALRRSNECECENAAARSAQGFDRPRLIFLRGCRIIRLTRASD